MNEIKIINNIKGEKLNNLIMVSFYLSGKLICKHLMMYMEFGTNWILITIGDDVTRIRESSFSKANTFTKFSDDDTLYEYPISNYNHHVKEFIGSKLIDVKKLLYKEDMDSANGIIFYFENNKNIIFIGEYEDEVKMTFDKNDIPEDLIESSI